MSSSNAALMTGSTAILVLGMHRSGTSATTRVLNLLGAELGANLLEAQADNAKGFWEHVEAVEIHDELLAAFGRTWHDVREMPEDWLEQPASYAAIDKIVRLIRRDFADNGLWAVKDPRMCRLVPLWQRALERLGIRTTALIVVREPGEVAGSLHAREGWSAAHSDLMWTQHSLDAIRYTHGMPRSILSYGDLMTDWRGSIRRIGEQLGIEWPNQAEETFRNIDAFLCPEDQHHRSGNPTEGAADAVSTFTVPQQLYAMSLNVAAGRADWSQVSQLDVRYLEMASLFREVTQQKYDLDDLALERINHIHLIEREFESAGGELNHFRGLAAERASHIELLAARHQGLVDALAQRQEHIDNLERHGVERELALQSLGGELQATKATLVDLSTKQGQLIQTNEALSRRCLELDEALRQGQEQESTAFAEISKLRERCENLSQAFELTFSRKWLMRRLWDVTVKGFAAKDPGA